MATLDLPPNNRALGNTAHTTDHNKIVTAITTLNTDKVDKADYDAKGDLLVGTGADAYAKVTAGANGKVLMTDSSQTAGVKWGDAVWAADIPPGSPSSYDYEFEGSGTSLPSGWSWVNQGSSTYTEQYGSGYIAIPGATNSPYANRAITQAIPSSSSFEFRAKLRIPNVRAANYWNAGIVVSDGTKLMSFGYDTRGVKWIKWNSVSSYNSESGAYPMYIGDKFYIAVKKNSSSSWDHGFSTDGVAWLWAYTAVDVSAWMTPTTIGIVVFNEYNSPMTVAVDWFRKVA